MHLLWLVEKKYSLPCTFKISSDQSKTTLYEQLHYTRFYKEPANTTVFSVMEYFNLCILYTLFVSLPLN